MSLEQPVRKTDVDPVGHPSHYTRVKDKIGVECIDVIEALGFGFALGNAFKYLWRAGAKDPAKEIEDLSKARWYLDRHIENLKAQAAAKEARP